MTSEQLARKFRETYERLAPDYGCEIRKESAIPWDVMLAVCGEIIDRPAAGSGADSSANALREQFNWWLQHSDEQDIPVPRWMARAWLKEQGEKP
jgi:hypothetical protein